jgi:hypothetical protein
MKGEESKESLVTKEDNCSLCIASGLGQEPSCILECGHIFHRNCLKDQFEKSGTKP